MILDYIILQCIKKIKSERSTASIFHLLSGKRSAQTLQDANMYELTAYFGIYKGMHRSLFQQQIYELQKKKYITLDSQDNAHITGDGDAFLKKEEYNHLIKDLNGMEYTRNSDLLWLRLQLWIQTYTNIAHNNYFFVAITDNKEVQSWVKQHYSKYNVYIKEWLTGVYQELEYFLKQIDSLLADLFVERLSGYKKIGLTKDQLAKKYYVKETDIHIYQTIVIHKLIVHIESNYNNLKYIQCFYTDINSAEKFMTDSAKKTNRWLNKGFDLNHIAKIRNLKISTIQDHVIEIAFTDSDFVITQFVEQKTIDTIITAVKQLDTTKLKQIKNYLEGRYSYFEIRLVLAYSKTKAIGGE
ncbi:ATP-dependent DNA helicase RecQ [Paraliobacillus quinghaiensis]|uniref:ATP-dependent DNA helicase RecQ n=1 Tax=Paraliobacillus quinghaiensis TaxID=470815 RepID=A0A917THJ7_9BACI|nr:helix-turn-helix domain-containing protein [Paraliobacillus quinghaiensis]GGM22651.1 ATP-dependent DNA helicase RecQ [Paraliobacillus quinghaiensis]